MTVKELRAWQKRLKLKHKEAAKLLNMKYATYLNMIYRHGPDHLIPGPIERLCTLTEAMNISGSK